MICAKDKLHRLQYRLVLFSKLSSQRNTNGRQDLRRHSHISGIVHLEFTSKKHFHLLLQIQPQLIANRVIAVLIGIFFNFIDLLPRFLGNLILSGSLRTHVIDLICAKAVRNRLVIRYGALGKGYLHDGRALHSFYREHIHGIVLRQPCQHPQICTNNKAQLFTVAVSHNNRIFALRRSYVSHNRRKPFIRVCRRYVVHGRDRNLGMICRRIFQGAENILLGAVALGIRLKEKITSRLGGIYLIQARHTTEIFGYQHYECIEICRRKTVQDQKSRHGKGSKEVFCHASAHLVASLCRKAIEFCHGIAKHHLGIQILGIVELVILIDHSMVCLLDLVILCIKCIGKHLIGRQNRNLFGFFKIFLVCFFDSLALFGMHTASLQRLHNEEQDRSECQNARNDTKRHRCGMRGNIKYGQCDGQRE